VKTKPLTIPQPTKTTLQIPHPGGAGGLGSAAAAAAAAASHRLQATAATFAPLRAQTPISKPPVSLAVLQQNVPEGAKLTVVHAPTPTTLGGASTTIRPLNPVTIRTPIIKSPTASAGTVMTSTSAPVQFVPLPPGMRVASPGTGIRQQPATTVQFKPQDPQAAAAVAAAAAAAASSVRVTLIQSSTSLSKNVTTSSGASYFKPVTITTQPRAQLSQTQIVSSMGGIAAPPHQVRIGLNQASKMTVIPSVPFGQQVNVTLNPVAMAGGVGNAVPLSATPARILTAAAAASSATSTASTVGATRLISVPISSSVQSGGTGGLVGSTVSIQKASVAAAAAGPVTTVTTIPVAGGAKTISLPPYIPKSGTANLPVARVIPQPLAASESAPNTSLFIARPPQLQLTTSDGGPPVVLGGANVIRPGLTIQTASSAAAAAVAAAAAAGGMVATPTSIGGSPSRPGILRRRDGERSGVDSQSDIPSSLPPQFVNASNLTVVPASTTVAGAAQALGALTSQATTHLQPQVLTVPSAAHLLLQPAPSPPKRPESGGSSSGSTTLSATSSPPLAGTGSGDELSTAAAGGGAGQPGSGSAGPSPRKKPRKQAHVNREDDQNNWADDGDEHRKRKVAAGSHVAGTLSGGSRDDRHPQEDGGDRAVVLRRPQMQLVQSYRHTWKSRHNHFLRYTDIKSKEPQKPTVNELANQKHVMQKVHGWKIYHLSTQIEDITDMEKELSTKLNSLHRKLDKFAHRDLGKDVSKVQEIIKANLQRSKLIQEQLKDSKDHSQELFEHKDKVVSILHRYANKRQLKKRELK